MSGGGEREAGALACACKFELFPKLSFHFNVFFAIVSAGERADTADTSSLLVTLVDAVDDDASVATDGELGQREADPLKLFQC